MGGCDIEESLVRHITNAVPSFRYFTQHILPLSFDNGVHVTAPHTWEWADLLQEHHQVAMLAPRLHLKSTTIYGYLMWRILRAVDCSESWLYLSFQQELAEYHLRKLKHYIKANPVFAGLEDLTEAEGRIRFRWKGTDSLFEIAPSGILTFKRGWHGIGVIADDILADPAKQLDPVVIRKIGRIFEDDIYYLPEKDGFLHVVGTPQHHSDVFHTIRENYKEFAWRKFQAIVDEARQKSLWPERFPWSDIIQRRNASPRSFAKEMMCEPVWETDSYLDRDKLLACVEKGACTLPHSDDIRILLDSKSVVAGWDIGKKVHPSHFAVFYDDKGTLVQICDKWMDRWDYKDQLAFIQKAIDAYGIDTIVYDATRGEFDILSEQHALPKQLKPLSFVVKTKNAIATLLERRVNAKTIRFINDQRTLSEMLKVNSELDAYESDSGHGDSFWSIAMAVYAAEGARSEFYVPSQGLHL